MRNNIMASVTEVLFKVEILGVRNNLQRKRYFTAVLISFFNPRHSALNDDIFHVLYASPD